jgi:hypothetical protein
MTVAKEFSKYVTWDRGGAEPAGEYTYSYGKGNENHELGTGFHARKRIISAVKRAELFRDTIWYIILRGRWCDIFVLNVHAPIENKIDDMKSSCYEELEHVFEKFTQYHMKILLRDFNASRS